MLRPCGWGGPVPVPGDTSCLCRERLKAKGPSRSLSSALLPQTTTIELGKLRPRERQESPLCRCRRSKHVVGAAHGPMFSYLESLDSGLQPQRSGTLLHAPLDRAYMHTPCPQQRTPSQTRLFMCMYSTASRDRVQLQPLCHLVCQPFFNSHAHRAWQLTHAE